MIEHAYYRKILSETPLRDPVLAIIQQDQRPTTLGRTPEKLDQPEERQIPTGRTIPMTDSTRTSNKLDEYFQMVMNRFLKEQNLVTVQPPPLGTHDVDMESHPGLDSWEYDPDDLGIPSARNSGRAAVATAAIGSGNALSLIQRVRISTFSDLKEFTRKDMDEDRARAWIGKVKLAFQRDQATEEEKCLTFGGVSQELAPTVKSDYQDQMGGSTRKFPNPILCQWRGNITIARKRSEETPLDYLYRLNVAALRAKLKIKDGNPNACREHVDHYIETLGDPELADRLTLLQLADVDELEEVLRARERAKSRQRRSAFGSKFRQKAPAGAPTAPARAVVRAIQTHDPSSESKGVSGSDGSDSEGDLRRIFLAAVEEKLISTGGASQNLDPA
ncbi:LOW QUALITY PROTEIN: hypothetical protein PHMEG_00034386, partial [Phytophthora megakarya]